MRFASGCLTAALLVVGVSLAMPSNAQEPPAGGPPGGGAGGGFQVSGLAPMATVTLVPEMAATLDLDVPGGLSGPQGSLKLEYSGLAEEEGGSPPLEWTAGPEGTQSYAIIMQDMPATGDDTAFLHWVVYNIPGDVTGLAASVPEGEEIADVPGAVQMSNSMGGARYLPPGPPGMTAAAVPAGGEDQFSLYTIQLFALDTVVEGDPADIESLVSAMDGHVLAYGIEHIVLQRGAGTPMPPPPQ